jgi:hypothetical protein
MNGFCFRNSGAAEISVWLGEPDCDAAHVGLRDKLASIVAKFDPTATLDNRLQGNLGEFIAFFVGEAAYGLPCIAPNALAPLSNISRPDLDIVWLSFSSTADSEDLAILQEVKTTLSSTYSYATALLDDYNKFFEVDPATTLASRLTVVANQLEFGPMRNRALAQRVLKMIGTSPDNCPQIRITPTLVHDLSGGQPNSQMNLIRTALVTGKRWPPASVSAWAIGLSQLGLRLQKLLQGEGP